MITEETQEEYVCECICHLEENPPINLYRWIKTCKHCNEPRG